MSIVTRFARVAVLSGLLAGCLPGATGPTGTGAPDEAATGTVSSALGVGDPGCPEWGCGMNSPTLADGVVFDELDTSETLPDRHGIQIVSVQQAGHEAKLHIDRHFIVVLAIDGSGKVFEHYGLIGTVIELDKGGTRYQLLIDDVQEQALSFWAGDTSEFVPFYRILVKLPTEPQFKTPICMPDRPLEKVWGPVEHHAIAFTGDRYVPELKTVTDAERGTSWFNFACAGTATAKMHLVRHTNAGAWTAATWHTGADVLDSGAPFRTDWTQRQAMLKMYTADYCGNGLAFTVDGQPLLYDDAKHWYVPPDGVPRLIENGDGTLSPPGAALEALWTPNGAACVSALRLVSRSIVPCLGGSNPRPACTTAMVRQWVVNPGAKHVISANPP
jgi:ADYC domain-containing protein